MRPDFRSPNRSGFSLPVVIFILVVIATLAGAMARLIGGGGMSTAFEVQSTRAYLAARSGLEWAANATLSSGGNCTSVNGNEIDFDTMIPPSSGLNDCNATIGCNDLAPNDLRRRDGTCNDVPLTGSQNCTVSLFLLSSNATCGTGPAQARRNLQWLVGKETQ